jgi:hypothetical protein
MPLRETSDTLLREHEEILRLADRFAAALALAASEDFAARQTGLAELRTLRPGLLGITRHCTCDNGALEPPYECHLEGQRYEQMEMQHKCIHRLIVMFLRELLYATADSIAEAAPQGEELLAKIREHIAYERDLLNYVEDLCAITT